MFELSARSVISLLGRMPNQTTSLALRAILIGRAIAKRRTYLVVRPAESGLIRGAHMAGYLPCPDHALLG
jgi:hypothetical protein